MEYDIYICTATKTVWTSVTNAARPKTPARLQTHLKINVFFFDSTAADPAAALLDSYDSLRLAVKPSGTPSASPLIYSSSPDEDTDHYTFEWNAIDGADLRALLGDEPTAEITFELAWTIDSVVERAAWPAICENAIIRSGDGAPNPVEDASDTFVAARALCYDRAQELTGAQRWQALANLGITFVNGCLRVVMANGDINHIELNSGEPPAP